ncbi:sulfite exporter TauE/SafE family protein [Agaribacterium haliotis]|uniref:sulfite exporter TauE/SafE family protein n=1 Tax=Agaribacterium haliotis TaxID=2013869 RepID=UPI000BB56AED|nr:sulfite exporter TauE/SafE family protein [Agaribacterium haliotis]
MDLVVGLLALICAGCCAGLLAGLFGVGGGIVVVPVLYFLLQAQGLDVASAMLIASATSLAIMISTSFSSMRSHFSRGNVDVLLLRRWGPFIFVSAAVVASQAVRIGGLVAALVFACVAFIAALNMLCSSSSDQQAAQTNKVKSMPAWPGQAVYPLSIGAIAVLMGVGGGTLTVPVLSFYGYTTHRAVGTAAVFGFLIALPGAFVHLLFSQTPADAPAYTWGLISVPALVVIMPLAALCAPLGVRLGTRFSSVQLKKVFAYFLLCCAVFMFARALY